VGITARKDCLGPKVLKGLIVDVGKLYEEKKDCTNASAPILVAE
jgi:hypothetical protein